MHHEIHTAELVTGIIVLFFIAAIVRLVTERLKVPFTVALVLVGITIHHIAQDLGGFWSTVAHFKLTPDMILFIFLPTLIFESAFNLDAKQLKRSMMPVLTLAVPGLLISTGIIGSIVYAVSDFSFSEALLLGAILSATDPVAVIALFKQLGAPGRLTVLVEGESLFNDATSLVLAKIITGIVVLGIVTPETVFNGVSDFFVVFLGGVVVGVVISQLACFLLGFIRDDPFIEITLTTILAYCSFLVAEELLHVSGIMAVVAAGIILAAKAKAKISPSVRHYMHHFWEYLAFIANALIFLLVGLQVELSQLWGHLDLLGWLILAMLLSRALVIFGLVPVVGRLPRSQPISLAYRAVMYWGGLRGAIALAIVLSLPEFGHNETFVTLVLGAVLFTLIGQGLSIEWLVKRLGLDQASISERLIKTEGYKKAHQQALSEIPSLQEGGLFSKRMVDQLMHDCKESINQFDQEAFLLQKQLSLEEQTQLLFLQTLIRQKHAFYDMFSNGHLTEAAFNELDHRMSAFISKLRFQGTLPPDQLMLTHKGDIYNTLLHGLEKFVLFKRWVHKIRTREMIKDYYVTWGHYHAVKIALDEIASLRDENNYAEQAKQAVYAVLNDWHTDTKQVLDDHAEQFPEFVQAMQARLSQRMVILQEMHFIEKAHQEGSLPTGTCEHLLKASQETLLKLRDYQDKTLDISPQELLKTVPFFTSFLESEFSAIAEQLEHQLLPGGEDIIKQGESGHSMYLVARGVLRVFVTEDGKEKAVATLMAGDFFGEMALLLDAPRFATVRSITPCSLYKLEREALTELCEKYPNIYAALKKAGETRLKSLNQ